MPIRFICTSCEKRIRVPDGSEGRRVKCPKCGAVQRVPEDGDEAQVQVLEPPPQQEKPQQDEEQQTQQPQAADPDNPLAALAAMGGGEVGDDDDTPPSPPPKRSAARESHRSGRGDRSSRRAVKPETDPEPEPDFAALAAAAGGGKPDTDDEDWPGPDHDTAMGTDPGHEDDGTKSAMVRALRGEEKPPPSEQTEVFSALTTGGAPPKTKSKATAPKAISLSKQPSKDDAANIDDEPTHDDAEPSAPFERPAAPAVTQAAVPAAPAAPAPRPVRMPPYSMLLAMSVILILLGLAGICFGAFLALSKKTWLIEYRLMALVSGLIVGSVTWSIGEALKALRDLARNSFRLGQ